MDADAAEQAREQAGEQERAEEAAAEAQARAEVAAEKRAAQLAAASQRAQVTWAARGRPEKMIIVRSRSIDLVDNGRLIRQVQRLSAEVTVSILGGLAPGSWVRVDGGVADLSAAIVLTPGITLTLGGDVQTVRLAGGPTPSNAASIHTGHGRLILRGVTVSSFDPATQQALPVGPGRPYLNVSGGAYFEAVDSVISDLGTDPNDPTRRAGLNLGEGSTGSLVRTVLAGNSIGLQLDRTNGVRLDSVTVSGSVAYGIVLRGDQGTTLSGVKAQDNGADGVLVTGPSTGRPIAGITSTGNKLFGLTLRGQNKVVLNNLTTSGNVLGGLRVSWSTDVMINDFSAADDPIGIYTHVGSTGIALNRARIGNARRGLHIEKTTRGMNLNEVTVAGASVTGISVGGHQVEMRGIGIVDSVSAMRIERGAGQVSVDGMTITGGQEGVVAQPSHRRRRAAQPGG